MSVLNVYVYQSRFFCRNPDKFVTKDFSLRAREYSKSSGPNIFELNTTIAISRTKFDSRLRGGVRLCGKWGEALREKV